MYRTAITLTVLSEEPIHPAMEAETILVECDRGDYVLHSQRRSEENIGIEQMAYALQEAGSDPDFFQLDSVDVEALITDWQYEVRNGDTMRGFHDWLDSRWNAARTEAGLS